MKKITGYRSLRIRISWLLARQSFSGLALVCLAVYLVTVLNFFKKLHFEFELAIWHLMDGGGLAWLPRVLHQDNIAGDALKILVFMSKNSSN